MAALSLTKYASISNYKKCGEILKSPLIGEKQYAMLCLQCHEICLQFQSFVLHIEKEHDNCFLDVKTEENLDISSEEGDVVSSDFDKSDSEEDEDNKEFLMDPLGEPEVLVIEKKPLREKDHACNRQTRQTLNTSNRKTQNKVIPEREVKKEPDDIYTETVKEMSKEFGNTSSVQNDETELDLKIFENKRDDLINISKFDDNDYDFDDDYTGDDNEEQNEEFLEVKRPPTKKSKIIMEFDRDIDEFMQNKEKVLQFIKAYQTQDELWDATRPPKLVNRCRKKREECLNVICKEMEKVFVEMTTKDAEKCIKYMRVRYIREVRIRTNCVKSKEKDFKPLWFHDHLDFLKPTLRFIQELEEEQTLYKTELNDEQVKELIDIYKAHRCLWDEQDVYYNSEKRRRETLHNILTEIKEKLHLNYTPADLKEKIEFIHKIVRKEKENIMEHNANKPTEDYKSSCKFYKYIEFLFDHLGPFKCQFCSKVISHIYTFRLHIAKHDGSKPFKCSVCKYEFTQKPGYVIHLRRHTQDFPFVCKYCSKGFPCKKELKLHFQNHPEYEKDYICDICGEGFTQQKLLNWHLKAHNNIRDSICKICGKGFTNSKLLFQHRTVHSQKKSVCKLCGKSYAHYRGLYRHMTKDHGTTVAAVAAVMGEKPKKRVLALNDMN